MGQYSAASYANETFIVSLQNGYLNSSFDARISVNDLNKTSLDTTPSSLNIDYIRIHGTSAALMDHQLLLQHTITISDIQMDWYILNMSAYLSAGSDNFTIYTDQDFLGTINSTTKQYFSVTSLCLYKMVLFKLL